MTVRARLAAAFRCRRFLSCLFIGVTALASWAPRGGGPIDLRWDGGAYYILGTSLAEGDGYRMRSEPGGIASSLHPPLVPAFVALHELALQTTDPVVVGRALKVSLALGSAAYAVAVFLLLSASLPLALAAGVTLVALLQPQYVFFSGTLYAEGVFGLLTVLFFVVRKWRRDALGFALCAVCAVLAYETRTAGIALLAAWVVDHALRKEGRRALIALAVSALVVTSWNSWIKAVESSPAYQHPAYAYQTEAWLYYNVSYARNLLTYSDPFFPERGLLTPSGFVRRVKSNVKILPQSIGQAVSGWWTPRELAVPLGVLVSGGLLLLLVRREVAVVVYVALSLAAICATPFQAHFPRYLLPLYPFLALALFELLAWLTARVRMRWPALPPALATVVPWTVLAVVAGRASLEALELYTKHYQPVLYVQQGRPVSYRLFYYGPGATDVDAALDWLNGHAAASDVIATADPQWAYLRTGRRAVLPPFVLEGRESQRLIDSVPVSYLITSTDPDGYMRFTAPLLAANPQAWRPVWSGPNGVVTIHERVGAPRP
ncbi:MAG: hypothetical protein H7125_13635 [Proteobacteria bacterium]|nr:hypothetical protein [Burkholderiales bacterium]